MTLPKDPIKREEWVRKQREAQKGQKRSPETKAKLSESHKGIKHTPEWIANGVAARKRNGSYANKMKGKKLPPRSEEWSKNISLSKIGNTPWNKGKKGVQISSRKGKKYPSPSAETKKLMSESHKGPRNYFYGQHHSEKTKGLIAVSKLGKPVKFSPQGLENKRKACRERIWTDDSRQKIKDKRMTWKMPYYDSKPERMMQIALTLNGIEYEKHKPFKLGKRWHQVDIFIEPNICVEVDGIHWHLEKKDVMSDLFQTQELTLMGYHVIRIRDKDILKNTQGCAEKVIQLIKELHYRYPLKS